LSVGLIAIVAALIILTVAIGGYSLRHMAEKFVAARLEHDLEAVLNALSFDANHQPHLATERLNTAFHQPYSGHYYQLQTANSEIRSRSLWDADLPLPPLSTTQLTHAFVIGPQNQRLLLIGRIFQIQNQQAAIAVTEDFTPLESGLKNLLVQLSLIAILAFGTLLLLQRWIVRRGLAPLEQVRRELPRLGSGDITQLSINAPNEVLPLVTELNRLLDLMNQRQRRNRQALGNLAHALKTPLTVLSQLTEHPPMETPSHHWWPEVRDQIQQIRQLTERELKRARIVGGGTPGQRVLLTREVGDLIETLRRIYRDRSLCFELQIPPDSVFPGDRDDLLELLGNLLDNACQWAKQTVRLSAGNDDDTLRLQVEDDGPGCPPDQLDLLRQRGVRIDESRAGSGLGLAIISDIVAQYQGRFRLDRSQTLGGLLAEVVLPLATHR
jgi:signal transduction histidine kinase